MLLATHAVNHATAGCRTLPTLLISPILHSTALAKLPLSCFNPSLLASASADARFARDRAAEGHHHQGANRLAAAHGAHLWGDVSPQLDRHTGPRRLLVSCCPPCRYDLQAPRHDLEAQGREFTARTLRCALRYDLEPLCDLEALRYDLVALRYTVERV